MLAFPVLSNCQPLLLASAQRRALHLLPIIFAMLGRCISVALLRGVVSSPVPCPVGLAGVQVCTPSALVGFCDPVLLVGCTTACWRNGIIVDAFVASISLLGSDPYQRRCPLNARCFRKLMGRPDRNAASSPWLTACIGRSNSTRYYLD